MKILVISNLFPPNFLGGYEVACADVVQALVDRGHDVTVLTSRSGVSYAAVQSYTVKPILILWNVYDPHLAGNAMRETTFFRAKVIDVNNLSIIVGELTAGEYDVVFCFNLLGLGGLAICDMLTSLRVPWAWHLMDAIPSQLVDHVKPEIRALFYASSSKTYRATRAFVISNRLKEEIERDVSLGPNAITLPGWARITDSGNSAASIATEKIRLVSIGVSKEKGTRITLEAISGLPPEIRNRIVLEIFGRGDIPTWTQQAHHLGIGDQVVFHGPVPHDVVLDSLPTFLALLFPTWDREPFGFVALEAASRGVVPIMTKGIGASELLDDRVHSIQIERTADSLRRAIVQIVENPDATREISSRAKAHVAKCYALDGIADRIENELAAIATGAKIDQRVASRAIQSAIFKDNIAREYVGSRMSIEHSPSGALHPEISQAYRDLKNAGRKPPTSPLKKLFRSMAMRLMRPYFVELLSHLYRQEAVILDLKSQIHDLHAQIELKGKITRKDRA